MTPNVIDISHHNTIDDFAALAATGIVGVIHKCTQGAGYADPMYSIRRKAATDAGLLWGAYSFNTGESIAAQVSQFLSHAEASASTLMALDFEDNPSSQMTLGEARQFLQQANTTLGRKLVLYSGNRAKDLLGNQNDPFLGGHRLWVAQYGPKPKVQFSWVKTGPWLWQYSEIGQLPGTDGNIDLNFYDGDSETLAREWAS